MRIFYKVYILCLILSTIVLSANDINVSVKITPKQPHKGENVKVVVNVDSVKKADVVFPDINKIASLPILAIKDNTKQNIVEQNGQKVSVVRQSRSFTIAPTKEITVEPITLLINGKKYVTKQHDIKIAAAQKRSASLIFRMSSSKKDVIVGEPFIVKVELIEPLAASNANLKYEKPKFKNFKASTLGDGQTIEKDNAIIRTIRYLVTAKKAGEFTIDPATARIGLQATAQVQSPFAFFGVDTRWKNLSSNKLKIHVAAVPNGIGVIGEFKASVSIDKNETNVNQPVNLVLTITGKGNLDDIKSPKFTLDNVTVYSDDAKIKHAIDSGAVESRYTKKYVFISSSDFVIPKISIRAYDPKSRSVYNLTTNKYLIYVKKPKSITSLLDTNTSARRVISKISSILNIGQHKSLAEENKTKKHQSESSNNRVNEKIENILIDKNYYYKKYSHDGYKPGSVAALTLISFILGLLTMFFAPKILLRFKRKSSQSSLYNSYDEALNILYPHTTDSPLIEEKVKKLYERVNGNKDITINDRELHKMVKKVLKKKKR